MNNKPYIFHRAFAIAFILGIIFSTKVSAQYDKDYTPIVFSGKIPQSFLFSPEQKTMRDVKHNNTLKVENAERFYASINFELKKLLMSGAIYFNDPMTKYVNDVYSKLFEKDSFGNHNLKIYVTRFPSANAITLPDGSIFVNAGLLAMLDNESQLAYILGHEVAHWRKKHSLVDYQKDVMYEQENGDEYNQEEDILNRFEHSRDNEFEADAVGLQYTSASSYDARESVHALLKLKMTDSVRQQHRINLHKYFKLEFFNMDSSAWFIDKNEEKSTSQVVNITTSGEENADDDRFRTHPDIDKRQLALREILSATEYKGENSKKNIVGDANNIRKIARFEMTNYFRITGDYGLSIYYSLQLLEEHPDNYFLAMNVLKSLYMLSKYKESNSIEKFMSKPESDSNGYKQVYTFLSRLTTSGYKRLTYAYAKSLNEKFKEKDNYFFYMCLAMEAYVGKDAARLYFAQYLTKFPNGDNTPFVKYKLNQ